MSQIVNHPSPSTLSPTNRVRGIPSTAEKLRWLATLSGLTCFEQEFIARLRAKNPDDRELFILQKIWHKHGGTKR